jgi:putative oxidoreductase
MSAVFASVARKSVILIRLMVGGVFLSEGLQKFLDPAARGAGRFEKIGIPWPELMGPFVGAVEASCGALVLAGLFTRIAVLPLIGVMIVALVTTKIPILLGESFWGLSLRELPSYGFWSAMHESRTDLAMLLGSLYLFIVGAGPWSVDWRIQGKPG